MCNARPLFYFCIFYKQLTGNIGSIKVSNDWIRTAEIWCRKQLLCQLSHNDDPRK